MQGRSSVAALVAAGALSFAGCSDTNDSAPSTAPPATSPPSTVMTTIAPGATAAASTVPEATTSTRPVTTVSPEPPAAADLDLIAYPVPSGSHPHDVAPAVDGGVWYTAQRSGELGWLDPITGDTRHVPLGPRSAPHGVIVGLDGAPWVTDSGLNAIVTVDPETYEVTSFPLPDDRPGANLNTASFDGDGVLWFTGQAGVYGSLDPATGVTEVYDAPGGAGPYGITTTPTGDIFYASLAGSHIAAIGPGGEATVIEPPTPDQGARRVWADSVGAVWVSEWHAGQVSRFEPPTGEWGSWRLPGDAPQAYAVWVDELDAVWVSDFGANALVRFLPERETFDVFPLPHDDGAVRQILGRPGEVWGAESGADHLVVVRQAP